jgi:DNA-binding transcriptional ArsR family regulator
MSSRRAGRLPAVHLVPADRAGSHIIDEHTVCAAIEAVPHPQVVAAWAHWFDVLSDPTRLRLLLAIKAAGPISVTDLAVATDIRPDTVSQTLRHLRADRTVTAERSGRVIRYTLTDTVISTLLAHLTQSALT